MIHDFIQRFKVITSFEELFSFKADLQKVFNENRGCEILDKDYDTRVRICQNAKFFENLVDIRIQELQRDGYHLDSIITSYEKIGNVVSVVD